jgi:hypothetical protein
MLIIREMTWRGKGEELAGEEIRMLLGKHKYCTSIQFAI